MFGDGRAGLSALLCLAPTFRGKHIGTVLNARERQLFAAWGASEHHADAGCEAKESGFWLRRGFQFGAGTSFRINELWEEYCGPTAQLLNLPGVWADWPEEFRAKVCDQLHPTILLYAKLP